MGMEITLFAVLGVAALLGVFVFLLLRSYTKLRLSDENIRLLLDSTAEGIFGVDIKGNCTFCNKSALQLFGYTSENELIGENMHCKVHYKRPDGTALPLEECRFYKTLSNGEGIHIEDEVFWRTDGTGFYTECFSYPQYRNGEVIGAVITFIDISERIKSQNEIVRANEELECINEQLQKKQYSLEEQNTLIEELNSQLEDENTRYLQQKETLQAIVDSLGAGVMMVNQEHKVLFINDAWRNIFSYLNMEDSLNPDDDFYVNSKASQNTGGFIRNMLTGMVNGPEISKKFIELLKDDTSRYSVDIEQTRPFRRYVNIYSNPCISHSQHAYGRVFVIRDISQQKEVDRLKLELISTVSHELRTPMSSILGFSELLLTRKLSEERNREYLSIMNAEARRLTDLINDFLDIQRMESGKQIFDKQYNSMEQIVEDAVKLFETEAGQHKIVYERNADCEYMVSCDRSKILQVMSNLLSNAIKYSPGGGDIKIDVHEDKGRVVVSVSDHGLGIPEGVNGKLFTKFFRVNNDDRRKIGGTGLGLAICREIMKIHGGEIWVESTYGQGSTFYFCLPSDPGNTGEMSAANDTNRSDESKGRLLIVEDDISIVRLVKEILKEEGLEIHNVGSGEEAIKLTEKYKYSLILLDISLSGRIDGWDVLEELKKRQDTMDTPVIVSSVYDNNDIDSHNGFVEYLVKPFAPEQLVNIIRKTISPDREEGLENEW